MEVSEIECVADHLHLSVSALPRLSPSRVAQILKSVSTKMLFEEMTWLKQHYWGGEAWAGGYFVRSVGDGATREMIEKYVRDQAEEL